MVPERPIPTGTNSSLGHEDLSARDEARGFRDKLTRASPCRAQQVQTEILK